MLAPGRTSGFANRCTHGGGKVADGKPKRSRPTSAERGRRRGDQPCGTKHPVGRPGAGPDGGRAGPAPPRGCPQKAHIRLGPPRARAPRGGGGPQARETPPPPGPPPQRLEQRLAREAVVQHRIVGLDPRRSHTKVSAVSPNPAVSR